MLISRFRKKNRIKFIPWSSGSCRFITIISWWLTHSDIFDVHDSRAADWFAKLSCQVKILSKIVSLYTSRRRASLSRTPPVAVTVTFKRTWIGRLSFGLGPNTFVFFVRGSCVLDISLGAHVLHQKQVARIPLAISLVQNQTANGHWNKIN